MSLAPPTPDQATRDAVIWHDLECGTYRGDLSLWRALAADHGDPVLEVGAGTGRVALDLARHGHALTALDIDAELLAALRRRAAGLDVHTVVADARSFSLERRFALIAVPMQTVQVLGDRSQRLRFLACAKAHLTPAGRLAVAITEELKTYELAAGLPVPAPDVMEQEGVVYSSRPTAIRRTAAGYVLERRRERIASDEQRAVEVDTVEVTALTARQLEQEARRVGLSAAGRRIIPATSDHVGSTLVIFHG